MLGAIMLLSKLLMEALPNVHLVGMLTVVYTAVYRRRALIPIYIYVILNGILAGFSLWWLPYTYIWTILWALTMLVPQNIGQKWAMVIYPALCGIHGFAFGTLYAPAQALMFGLDFDGMIAWIVAGLPFDLIHGISNVAIGVLALPLIRVLKRLEAESE